MIIDDKNTFGHNSCLQIFDKLKLFRFLKNTHYFIAGGCFKDLFNNKKPKDIDIFFINEVGLNEAIKSIIKDDTLSIDYENDHVVNVIINDIKIQLVKKYFFKNAEDIFKTFDFTITKFAYNGFNVFYSKRFFQDLFLKKLVIDNQTLIKPLSTLERSYRYCGYGYTLCPVGMEKIAKGISDLRIDWNNPDENHLVFYGNEKKFISLD